MADDDFQRTSEAFLSWFKSQPGAQFHQDISITDLRSRNAGRGIVATKDIPPETELFSIPRPSVICVDTSEVCKKLPRVFSTLPAAKNATTTTDDDDEMDIDADFPDPWLDLIVVMVYEYLRGPGSRWKPYFGVFPDSFDSLMFWKEGELEELQASGIRQKVGREDADGMFKEKVVPVVRKHEDIFYPEGEEKLSDDELVELCHKMGSTIMAYAFDLEKENEDEVIDEDGWVQDNSGVMTMGMVPMADMLNADAEFNAHLNHGEERLVMTSLRTIKSGEEILNYYGPLANSELLRRYGYTSPKHSRYDVVEMPWDLIARVINAEYGGRQKAGFDSDDEDFEDSFVLERESGDPDDTGINTSKAEFVGIPDEMEEQIIRAVAPALGVDVETQEAVSKGDKRRLKAAALEITAKVIEERLKEYKTTGEEDEEILKKEETKGRLRMALEVRLGEKKLLYEAKEAVAEMIRASRETMELSGPSVKRQRF